MCLRSSWLLDSKEKKQLDVPLLASGTLGRLYRRMRAIVGTDYRDARPAAEIVEIDLGLPSGTASSGSGQRNLDGHIFRQAA
jgi:hypothetical protein